MLSMIDQGWREHLYEMDYLQEGINLRAMGQRDPLSEWQREGFDMFEAMMGIVEDNFVRYMFHIDVQVLEQDEKPRQPVRRLSYSAPEDPVQGSDALQAANRPLPGRGGGIGERGDERGPDALRGRDVGSGRGDPAGAGREDARPERALLVRERQEVQALPRPLKPTNPTRIDSLRA